MPAPKSSQFECPDQKGEFIPIQTLKRSHCRTPHENQVNADLPTEIKSSSPIHTTTKSISSLQLKSSQIIPHKKQANFVAHTKTKPISTAHIKLMSVDHAKSKSLTVRTKNKVNLDQWNKWSARTQKNKVNLLTPARKTSLFGFLH